MATDVILPSSVEEEETRHGDQGSEQIKEKQLVSSQKFQRFDSLDIESRSITNHRNSKVSKKYSWFSPTSSYILQACIIISFVISSDVMRIYLHLVC